MPEKILVDGGNDQWSVSKAIGPQFNNNRDDVRLIQTMLVIFLTAPSIDFPASDRAEIDRIFTALSERGGKFSDGIYGSNTRTAIGILERHIGSPVKDGVIRPIFETDAMGRMSGFKGTKMRDLNDIWDDNAISDQAASKKESGRRFLNPDVFVELYPGG